MNLVMPRETPAQRKARSLEVGLRLIAARQALGYGDRSGEFAEGADLESNAYSQYETGARWISREAAIQLCDKYPLTLDFIYRGKLGCLRHDLAEKIEAEYKRLTDRAPAGIKVVSVGRKRTAR